MPLDPVTAIGLLGSSIQFVDFSCKLFSQTREIYVSCAGATKDASDLTKITESLRNLSSAMSAAPANRLLAPAGMKPTNSLAGLLIECRATAEELLGVLETIRAKQPGSKWSSFQACLKSVWKKSEIDRMAQRVDSFRLQLILELEVLQDEKNSVVLSSLEDLLRQSYSSNLDMSRQIKDLREDLLKNLKLIGKEFNQKRRDGLQFQSFEDYLEPVTDSATESPISKLSSNKHRARHVALQIRALQQLQFPGMHTRHRAIHEAHPRSCLQAYDQKLGPWFSSESSLFWVSGKPGSGKSTLMKFLVGHAKARKELLKWSGLRKLVVSSHFLWIGGNTIQKSQEGLLRSLLFGILEQEPDLIQCAFPELWQSATLNDYTAREAWTYAEMEEVFQRLTSVKELSTCYCIFIDGLDEYQGDKDQLVSIVKHLAAMPNMKLIVASRPWNIFEAAFGAALPVENQIVMQDLNSPDIRLYVKDNLENLKEFKELKAHDRNAINITEEIIQNAQGVFLWVFLVVRSLKEGLRNFDRLVDLQYRLREFPSDLDEFFRHMFDSMDKVYRAPAARAFQVAVSAHESLSVLAYWYIDLEEHDSSFLFNVKNNPPSSQVFPNYKSVMEKRLNGRLKGLLEVPKTPQALQRVEFLHRTVRDFLSTGSMQESLQSWLPESFNPHELICKVLLAELMSGEHRGYMSMHVLRINIMYSAGQFERTSGRSAYSLISELEETIIHVGKQGGEVLNPPWLKAVEWKVHLAAVEWIAQLTSAQLARERENILRLTLEYSVDSAPPDPAMVRSVLDAIKTRTTIQYDLSGLVPSYTRLWKHDPVLWLEVLEVLSEYDLNLSKLLARGDGSTSLQMRTASLNQRLKLLVQKWGIAHTTGDDDIGSSDNTLDDNDTTVQRSIFQITLENVQYWIPFGKTGKKGSLN